MKFGKLDTNEPILNRLNGDKVIWIIVFLLSLISIALIYSSSSSLAYKEKTTNFAFLIKQFQFVLIGLMALFFCYKIPLGWYRTLTYLIFGISLFLLAITPILGSEINGAKRWLSFGGITFQPAELVKISIILYLARTLEMHELKTFKDFVIRVLAPIGLTCVLIMIGSVSTALFVGLLSFLVLFIAGVKWSYLFKSAGIAGIALVLLIVFHLAFGILPRLDTATSRLKKFFVKTEINETLAAEEKQKQADKTFQADMAKIAISSVGVIGKGPGNSTQRYVLPHPYSDYIFTIIIEEYGLIGGAFVLMLYLWFLFRCIILIKNCTKVFTAITVGGLSLLIFIQASLHILVNVGFLPVTGHTLPLISLGGTSLVILSCAFGIILSVSRTIDVDASKKAAREKEQMKEAETLKQETDTIKDSDNNLVVAQQAGIEGAKFKKKEDENKAHEIMDINGEFK